MNELLLFGLLVLSVCYCEVGVWDGSVDTTWYSEGGVEFTLSTGAHLAGFSKLVDEGTTFEGKTIKLGSDINLYHKAEGSEEATCFNPIGSYRHDKVFKGIFNGQGHVISNLYQNTWCLDTGYYFKDLGLGLFGKVEDATIKNLIIDGVGISGENGLCGAVAATAYGNCIFDTITVRNINVNDYEYYAGGIVGWASGNHQYININVEDTTTVGEQWGAFGTAMGCIIGGASGSGSYFMKNSIAACRIDSFNDVTSAYQWWQYRSSGMLMGDSGHNPKVNGSYRAAIAPNLTCNNVTVIYGEWANYHYCEFAGTGYPWVRRERGVSTSAYSNPRYGHPTDANGKTVEDDNHVHNEGEHHMVLRRFDQLYGGPGNHRWSYQGVSTHEGVTVIYNNK